MDERCKAWEDSRWLGVISRSVRTTIWHSLRLGLAGQTQIAELITLSGDVAPVANEWSGLGAVAAAPHRGREANDRRHHTVLSWLRCCADRKLVASELPSCQPGCVSICEVPSRRGLLFQTMALLWRSAPMTSQSETPPQFLVLSSALLAGCISRNKNTGRQELEMVIARRGTGAAGSVKHRLIGKLAQQHRAVE